jgi:nucleoside-diphosphate-sugar epimerase
MRLDLTVNILTNHAVHNRVIKVFGGAQRRPNIHIEDMTDLYIQSLAWPAEKIDGQIYNAGYENHRVSEIAGIVQNVIGKDVRIETTSTDDNRSYHISSERIRRDLGFAANHTIEDAVRDIASAFSGGKLPNSMSDIRYYNIKTMQSVGLQ